MDSPTGNHTQHRAWRLEWMPRLAECQDPNTGAVLGIRVPFTSVHLEMHVEHAGSNQSGWNAIVVERDWRRRCAGVPSGGCTARCRSPKNQERSDGDRMTHS